MKDTAFALLPELLPIDHVRIGSLIASPQEPHIDAYIPTSPIDTPLTATYQSLTGLVGTSQRTDLSLKLSQLLNIHHTPSSSATSNLSTRAARRIEIQAQRDAFKAICKEAAAKEWFEDGFAESAPSYFIVGLMTVLDASLSHQSSLSSTSGATLTVPLSTFLSSGADVLVGGLNPSIGAEAKGKEEQKVSYAAQGEMVWAIAYRKVKYEIFRKKSVETARLDTRICWKPLSAQRARSDEDEEVFEVELEEEQGVGDGDGDEDGDGGVVLFRGEQA